MLQGAPESVLVRNEEPADAAAIEAVTVAAFLEAPYSSHTEQFIVAALRTDVARGFWRY